MVEEKTIKEVKVDCEYYDQDFTQHYGNGFTSFPFPFTVNFNEPGKFIVEIDGMKGNIRPFKLDEAAAVQMITESKVDPTPYELEEFHELAADLIDAGKLYNWGNQRYNKGYEEGKKAYIDADSRNVGFIEGRDAIVNEIKAIIEDKDCSERNRGKKNCSQIDCRMCKFYSIKHFIDNIV